MKLSINDIKKVPNNPGVYLFYSRGNIVYIGKSKNLKSRVRSYFSKNHNRKKLYIMMDFVDDLKYILCDTHLEARLLEYKLIRKYKPIYNSQFKNEKSLCYIEVSKDKLITISDKRFGPVLFTRNLQNFIKDIMDLFPIYFNGENFIFEKKLFKNRINENEKRETYKSLDLIFNKDKLNIFKNNLETKMKSESEKLNFESALFYKNLIKNIDYLITNYYKKIDFHNKPHYFYNENKDIFIITYKGNIVAKDIISNIKLYENMDFSKFKPNSDEEYKNIIFSEYLYKKD